MLVFVLFYYWQSEAEVVGVYSTKELAESHRNAQPEPTHYEVSQLWMNDPPKQW